MPVAHGLRTSPGRAGSAGRSPNALLLGLAHLRCRGLPDLPGGRSTIATAAAATAVRRAGHVRCASWSSAPRCCRGFTVFGAAGGARGRGRCFVSPRRPRRRRARGGDRDRVVFVGPRSDASTLADDVARRPRAARRAPCRVGSFARARPGPGAGEEPLVDAGHRSRRDRPRARAAKHRTTRSSSPQASTLHEGGCARPLAHCVLRRVAGASSRSPSSNGFVAHVRHRRGARVAVRPGPKRLFDIVVGLVGVLAFVVVAPFVAIGKPVREPGAACSTDRTGSVRPRSRSSRVLKFRTMRPHDGTVARRVDGRERPAGGPPFGGGHSGAATSTSSRRRSTSCAAISRSSGPRPEQPHYVKELSQKLPYYGLRHLVRPGLTGGAQVKYGYAGQRARRAREAAVRVLLPRSPELALRRTGRGPARCEASSDRRGR